MIKKFRAAIVICGLFSPLYAYAWNYSLVQDMGVQGMARYCKYDNGKVYTVNASDICQISIVDSAPGLGNGQGFLKGEYPDGMNKVCVYDVLGQQKAIRISSVAICPPTSNF
ncbi:hypothetical protein HX867_13115 [Pseudomonas gingeri]|uniref:hypothetical protein n=1 Tax=Pseudomonas TaxID=286 RepID=UPI0015A17D05|nr:hypothetical protein [Pseudomonas gingeri]NVZ63025.1 hypothetical protein [Pseudomonas gingeri]